MAQESSGYEWALVVEPSATLRRALQRSLAAGPYRIVATASYEDGLRELNESAGTRAPAAVLLGFPLQTTQASEALLADLHLPKCRGVAVIVLAHAAIAAALDLVARRPRAALLLWEDCAGSLHSLKRLTAPTATPVRRAAVRDHIRVLFVDDARTVREGYQRLLERHGYAVATAASMSEAMALAIAQPFDLAIVDYYMPGGNGDELCRQLHADSRTAEITTAVITGTYLDQIIRDSLDAGATECMFKSESTELFIARIAAMARGVRAKKAIDAEHQRLAGILASVGDGVYGVNQAGQITFINPAARDILGLAESQNAIGASAHTLFHYAAEDGSPNPQDTCFLQQAYAIGDELRGWDTVFWTQAGRSVPVECTVFPLRVKEQLEGSVVAFRDVSDRRELERELVWQVNHDTVTRLCNRNHFERALEAEVSRLKRSEERSALLYIDLDRFKYINDTAGHAAGDRLLLEVGNQLQTRLREADTLARLGGDEFAIILRNVNDDGVRAAADGFREVLEQLNFAYRDKHYKINGSIGVALIDSDSLSPGEVLANADIACHIAKSRGRNNTHLYRAESDERTAMQFELGWSVRLQDALKDDSFALVFQPILPLPALAAGNLPAERGRVWQDYTDASAAVERHYEVLVRFSERGGALVTPAAFLPSAERFGLMPQLDAWILAHALAKLGQLHRAGQRVTFTINLSGQTIDADQLVPLFKRNLTEHAIDPRFVIFEITETSAIANVPAAKRLIDEMRDIGCRFALDDFGSGFSSLYHLKHLPVDFIKIDGQFVQDMVTDPIDRTIVTSINDIAHSLGKQTVAEFVESREILTMLCQSGIDFGQGHYIASPHTEPQ